VSFFCKFHFSHHLATEVRAFYWWSSYVKLAAQDYHYSKDGEDEQGLNREEFVLYMSMFSMLQSVSRWA
jgi:hypothetical protein